MEIKKIASFNEKEVEVLTTAGKLLGTVKSAFEAGEVTELTPEAKSLLDAVDKVLSEVRSK